MLAASDSSTCDSRPNSVQTLPKCRTRKFKTVQTKRITQLGRRGRVWRKKQPILDFCSPVRQAPPPREPYRFQGGPNCETLRGCFCRMCKYTVPPSRTAAVRAHLAFGLRAQTSEAHQSTDPPQTGMNFNRQSRQSHVRCARTSTYSLNTWHKVLTGQVLLFTGMFLTAFHQSSQSRSRLVTHIASQTCDATGKSAPKEATSKMI